MQATTQFIGDSTGEFVAGFGIEAAGACEHYRIVVLGACNREIHHVARWLRASMQKKPPVAGHSHRRESVSSTTTTRHAARGYLRPVVSGHADEAISQHPAAAQITISKRTIDVATRWFAPERVSTPTG